MRTILMIQWLVPIFAVVLLGVLMFAKPDSVLFLWKNVAILWGIGFGALCPWQSVEDSSLIAIRFFEYLGERSYSLYLLLPLVIMLLRKPLQSLYAALTPHIDADAYFVCVPAVLGPLVLLAEFTCRLMRFQVSYSVGPSTTNSGQRAVLKNWKLSAINAM